MAVIAALEFDDFVTPGRRARYAHHTHGGLGAGADESHALERRHQASDALAEFDFEHVWCSVARSKLRSLGERPDQTARRVPVDQRTPRHHVVDERVSVDIFEVGARSTTNEERRSADGLEGSDRAVHAARENAKRP